MGLNRNESAPKIVGQVNLDTPLKKDTLDLTAKRNAATYAATSRCISLVVAGLVSWSSTAVAIVAHEPFAAGLAGSLSAIPLGFGPMLSEFYQYRSYHKKKAEISRVNEQHGKESGYNTQRVVYTGDGIQAWQYGSTTRG